MSSNAPGQFLGYFIQPIRLLSHLLNLEEDVEYVSLEVLDDNGISFSDGHQILEQLKSDTSGNNPISQKSLAFWKTLRNWVDICNDDQNVFGPENCKFHITVYKKNTRMGDIQKGFSNASTFKEAESEYEYAKSFFHHEDISEETRKYLDVFFADQNRTLAIGIISHLSITISENLLLDLHSQLRRNPAIPISINYDLLLEHCLGWISEKIHQKLIDRLPCTIASRDFHNDLSTFISIISHRNEWYLPPLEFSSEQISTAFSAIFVKQLRLIDHPDEEIIDEINDYLSASHARIEWAKNGLANSIQFNTLEEKLVRNWKHKKKIIELDYKEDDDIENGQRLLNLCKGSSEKLAGNDLPPNFIYGSYHALANVIKIGWHPDYINLLKSGENNGDS